MNAKRCNECGDYMWWTNNKDGSRDYYCPSCNFFNNRLPTKQVTNNETYQIKTYFTILPLQSHPLSADSIKSSGTREDGTYTR